MKRSLCFISIIIIVLGFTSCEDDPILESNPNGAVSGSYGKINSTSQVIDSSNPMENQKRTHDNPEVF